MFAHVAPQVDSVEMETDNQTHVVDDNTPDQKVVNTLPSSGEIHQPAAAPVSMDETSSSTDRNDDLDAKLYSNRLNGFCIEDGENSDSRPPLSDELQQGYRILEDLMVHSKKTNNFLFMDPVDADDPQMKDYYQRIQEPMCLRTMLEKFNSRTYTDITEFYDDFMLMIKNCYRFWGPEHRLGKKAERFHTMFQQKIALLSSKVKEKMTNHSKGLNDDLSCSGIRRRGRSSMTQDSFRIFQEVQQEREQEEKEQRLRQQAERKAERKAQEQSIRDWDKNVLFEQKEHEMKAMWEIPQIQIFLWAAKQSLNLEEINIYETERAFYMPRQSSTLQKIMTSLLSTPSQRARLGRRNAKPMTYKVWNEKLAKVVALWYKTLKDCNGNHVEAASKLGIDKLFFSILGRKRNPLEKKAFHELTPFQRVWLVKSLCDYILEKQDEIRTAMDNENPDELRGLVLGQDSKGFTYIHFPQFCGPAVRFYRQAPLPDPTLDSEEDEEEEEEVAKEVTKRGKPSASSSSSRNSRSGTSTPQPALAKANSKKTSFKSRRLNGQQAEDISPAPGTPSSSTQDDSEETSSSKSKSRCKSRGKGSIRGRKTRNGINDNFDKLSDGTIDSIDTSDKVSQSSGRTCNGFKEKDESSGACEDNLMDNGSVQPKSENNSLKGAEPENRNGEGDESSVEDKMELAESELSQDGSGATGKTPMCNGDSQGRSEEEMDWEPSSHRSQSSCGENGPNSSACANSSSPQVKQEGGDVKAKGIVSEVVKVKVEPGVASGSSIKTERDFDNIPKSEPGAVSDTTASSESSAAGTAAPKQEVEEGAVKQEAEQAEEDEEEDLEITGPVIGEFELIADSVEALRQVMEELEKPETVVSKKGKRKVTKQVPRKTCDKELAERIRVSVEELSAWETRLNAATSRARVKIRREFEEFKPEESLQQDSADWETDPSSSGNEEDHSAQDTHSDLQENSMDNNSEIRTKEAASPAPMEYEIEFSSRGRMRKRKANPDDRPAKRQCAGDGSEDLQSASRLPNILQRQNKAAGPTVSILSSPGRAGLPGATIQVAVSRPEVSSAQFSASQLLKLSQAKGKTAIGVVPVSTRPALLRASAGASSKTGSHPVIQQLLSKQPQFSPRAPTASSLLVRQPVVRQQPVAANAVSSSSGTVNVQYIFTNNTVNTPSSSGTPRAQQTIAVTPAMLQQLLQLSQGRPQGNSSTGTTARVVAVSQQPSAGALKTPQTPKPPQAVLLTSQTVTPSTPSLTQTSPSSDTSPSQQAQLPGVAVAAVSPTAQVAPGGLKTGQGTKYASNVTVKALLENRAAQKAGVSVQGGTNQIVLAANAAGVPALLSRIQPAAGVAKPAKLTVQVPTPVTKTFSGDLDSAVRLVVTSVSTSLPTANIHVPSPALSPNLPRSAPAKTIMTSVMEQPIVTTKVQPITGQASAAQTSCLSSTATAQTALSVSAVKLASTPTLTTSPSPQKAVLCKVVQPGGQPVFQIVLPQGSLQQLSGTPTIQLGPTTTVAGSSTVSLSPSASSANPSPAAQQIAAVKAQLASGLRTLVSATVQQSTAPTVTSPAPSAAKQLTLSPQARLVQAPAAALVKQIAASQLAQAGSLVRVQGPAGSLAAGQVAGSLSTTSLLQQLSPGTDQAVVGQSAVVGQPAVVAPQAGQVIKAAGAGKTGYVLSITPTPAATQQRLQIAAGENPSSATTSASTMNSITVSKVGAAASPGLAQVPPLLLPQQSLNMQLLQNKLAGLVQGQGTSQPTRVVLMAQPGSSQASSLSQTVLQQASPQLGQQVIARGINASLAGQPQIVLTPSAGTAKTQLLVPGLAGRTAGLSLVPGPQSLGVIKLSGVTSAASAPAMTTVNTVHQALHSVTPGVLDTPPSVAALQQAGLKVARAAVSPANQTNMGAPKPSTPASALLMSHSAPQVAVSNLAAQSTTRIASKPAGAAAAATTSSSAASASKPAGEAPQRIRLLRVDSQLYTAEGIPVAVGSDGQLRALPLPQIQLSAELQQAMRNPEVSLETSAAQASSSSASLPSPAQSLAASSPSDSDTSPRAGSSTGRQQPVLSPSKLTASTAASMGSNPVSRSQPHQPQMQQRQPQNVGDGLLLINFAQSNQ